MGLFHADIKVRIAIVGCPEMGTEALDWRRARGLSERLDNRHDVAIVGEISESDFRALVSAGWEYARTVSGGAEIRGNSLRKEYCPMATYGHVARVSVRADNSPVELACLALRACAREQRLAELGAVTVERELARLERELLALDEQRRELVRACELEREKLAEIERRA